MVKSESRGEAHRYHPLELDPSVTISEASDADDGSDTRRTQPAPGWVRRKPHVAQWRIWIMDSFDFSPLFRSTIGFDHLMRLADTATRLDGGVSAYPPYNIESTGENAYRLTMAVAGFAADELD